MRFYRLYYKYIFFSTLLYTSKKMLDEHLFAEILYIRLSDFAIISKNFILYIKLTKAKEYYLLSL